MGRTETQHGSKSLRLRGVAAFLLLWLFGLPLAPLLPAQTTGADCCMAAEGKGCSMHLHRAAMAKQTGYAFAAVQPKCPCIPLAAGTSAPHGAATFVADSLAFVLSSSQATPGTRQMAVPRYVTGPGGTRGPPMMTFFA